MAAAAKASRYSALDHVYSAGVLLNVQVLPSAATDHRPLLAALGTESGSGLENRVFDRRNFKAIYSVSLCAALERHCVWEDVYAIKGADDSLAFIMRGINAALDDVAPVKSILVKAGAPLYLAADTRAAMKARDSVERKGLKYKHLRNEANRLVKQDHVRSNVSRLAKSRGDPRVVWQIAKSAMGQDSAQLPAALRVEGDVMTVGDKAAASLMNEYYISKVEKLKAAVSRATPPPPSSWPEASAAFEWTYMNAGKIRKLVNGRGATWALGPDNVPVDVYKKGVEVLCGTIAHLVNRSLATGSSRRHLSTASCSRYSRAGRRTGRSQHLTGQFPSSAPCPRCWNWS
jgi:hypothetical protein